MTDDNIPEDELDDMMTGFNASFDDSGNYDPGTPSPSGRVALPDTPDYGRELNTVSPAGSSATVASGSTSISRVTTPASRPSQVALAAVTSNNTPSTIRRPKREPATPVRDNQAVVNLLGDQFSKEAAHLEKELEFKTAQAKMDQEHKAAAAKLDRERWELEKKRIDDMRDTDDRRVKLEEERWAFEQRERQAKLDTDKAAQEAKLIETRMNALKQFMALGMALDEAKRLSGFATGS